MRRIALLTVLLCGLAPPGIGRAQDAATAPDRTAIAACLAKARNDKTDPTACVGIVQRSCLDRPESGTTVAMKICVGRENAVWDEQLNAAYRTALKGWGATAIVRDRGRKRTGADSIRAAELAWIAFRDRKCEAAALPMEGGSGAGLLGADCYLQETARHALWLESLAASARGN